MDNCPKCNGVNFCKDGIVKSRQRYFCKDCKHRFTVGQTRKSNDLKINALVLCLEGLGFRSIGRCLNVSHVAVCNWIKSFGEKLDDFRNSGEVEVVELDEMHTYIGSKKTTAGYGLLLIEMGTGSSTVRLAQGEQFWRRIEGVAKGAVCSDYWKAYNEFVPEAQMVQTKAETYTAEGYNSIFRYFLARLRRKTKCYTKAKHMLIYSLKLLMFKWNNDLAILF